MAQVLIELVEGAVKRRKFVDSDAVAMWAEAGWAVPSTPPTTGGQVTGYDAIVTDVIQRTGSLTKAAIDERVTTLGGGIYAPRSGVTQAQQVSTSVNVTDRTMAATTPPPFAAPAAFTPKDIVVYRQDRFQTFTGVGAALTDSAAYVLTQYLTASQRQAILKDLYSPTKGNLSTVRVTMGASDFNATEAYSYCDLPAGMTDVNLDNFTIDKDGTRVIPVLREILAINPSVRIIGSVWFAPAWMLTNPSAVFTGSQNLDASTYSSVWADYIVKIIKAYRDLNIHFYAVSVANEPVAGGLKVSATNLQVLIKALSAKLATAGLDTRILAHDDQWAQVNTLKTTLSDAATVQAIDGVAWHGYGGSPRAVMSDITKLYPQLTHHVTEYRSLTSESASLIMAQIAGGYLIDSLRYGAKSVTLWNLALDQNGNPTFGGATGRNGVIAVPNDSSGAIIKRAEYWALTHIAKYVRPGAVRIGSSSYGQEYVQVYNDSPPDSLPDDLRSVAFQNLDGSIALVCYNGAATARSFQIHDGGLAFPVTLPAGELATFTWGTSKTDAPAGTAAAAPSPVAATGFGATGGAGKVDLSWTAPVGGPALASYSVLMNGTVRGTIPGNVTSYSLKGLSAGTYTVALTVNTVNGSATSGSVSGVVVTALTPPAATTPVFDGAASGATNSTTATSLDVAHTVIGSTKNAILVAVGLSPVPSGSFSPRVSAVTYAGASLTRVAGPQDAMASPDGTNRVTEIWGAVGVTAGAGTVHVTSTVAADITVGVTSFTNVDQTTPWRTPGTAMVTSATPSVQTTGGQATDVVFAAALSRATLVAAHAGQTQVFGLANGRSANAFLTGSRQAGGTSAVTSQFDFGSGVAGSVSSVAAIALVFG